MKIVQKDSFKVVGIKVVADCNNLWVKMPMAWKNFLPRHVEIKNRVNEIFIDITLQKAGDEYTQVICSEVFSFENIPSNMIALEIPEQMYIYYRYVGPVDNIAISFSKMYNWAHQNGYIVDDFKLDLGYTLQGWELQHDLFIKINEHEYA